VLAQAGVRVTVLDAHERAGGGCRTAELTLPGFQHDVCSAVHALGAGSPFFRQLPLEDYGLRWIYPAVAMAHPFDNGSAAVLRRSLDETAAGLGADGEAYRKLMRPLAPTGMASRAMCWARCCACLRARSRWRALASRRCVRRPGWRGRGPQAADASHVRGVVRTRERASRRMLLGELRARARGGGARRRLPVAEGGSQAIADTLTRYLEALGGEVRTCERVESLEVDDADAVLFDLTPRQVVHIAGERLETRYRRSLEKFRYGPGVFKVDYALRGPVPWRAPECRRAGTVHLGGSMEEIVASEEAIARGEHPDRPYVLVAQQSLFDATRAPAGQHTLWAYCHVPNGSTVDMSERIDAQLERFAPGFRDLVLARHMTSAVEFEAYNTNYVGGDIGAGAYYGLQLLTRPAPRLSPYTTSDPRLFICSASTPPGAGVHGMCGYFAAQAALKRLRE
jgi:phytoene dehydrogenase-like protein